MLDVPMPGVVEREEHPSMRMTLESEEVALS